MNESLPIIEKIFKSGDIKVQRLSGGDINEVFKVVNGNETFVLKLNSEEEFPNMFEKEAKGLELLKSSETMRIPKVESFGKISDRQFLILEYINSSKENSKFWENFGLNLSELHSNSRSQFGLDHSNYIGSLIQKNGNTETWQEFLITQRIEPMVAMAVNMGNLDYAEGKKFEFFYNRINELYPDEQPALLHGDLWSGNYLINELGDPVLIDPAVYYGHREIDIGMMHLFGGFKKDLFETYNENYPLEKNWKDRILMNQIYPLMVHVNLFGRSYWGKVALFLKDFN